MSRKRSISVVAATVTSLALIGGTAAYAVQNQRTGGLTSRQVIIDQSNTFFVPTANVWTNVPSASATVTVPPNQRRLINVRYNAESRCTGPGFCSMRVVYRDATNVEAVGPAVELAPAVGTNFAFDSAGGSFEAHGFERTTRNFLPAGVYLVNVEAQRTGGATLFSLDDYSTHVELINP
jgi:hypothetical protein